MPDKIRIFIKRPDVAIEAIEVPNDLDVIAKLVEGIRFETIVMSKRLVAVFNEAGIMLDLPFNMYLGGHWLRGNILFVGVNGDEFTDAPFRSVRQVESAIREFNSRR